MSMVNADSVQLFAMLKKMQDSISSIETTKKSVKMKYEQLGAGWQDKKYNELGVVVRDCNKALNDILVIMLQAEKYVALLAKSLSEYESVQLGSTNGISASTPQTSSFAVTCLVHFRLLVNGLVVVDNEVEGAAILALQGNELLVGRSAVQHIQRMGIAIRLIRHARADLSSIRFLQVILF